jgi:cytochrome d ubiquinol oxidase subunit II
VLVGVTALLVLMLHGALWVMLKTAGPVATRARAIASTVYRAVCVAVRGISVASFVIQPHLAESYFTHPWLWVFPLLAAVGLIGLRLCFSARVELWAFLCPGVFIVALLCSAAFGLYPNVLPSITDPNPSLTINNVAAPDYGLRVGLASWIPAFILATTLSFLVYRHFRGKVQRVDATLSRFPRL